MVRIVKIIGLQVLCIENGERVAYRIWDTDNTFKFKLTRLSVCTGNLVFKRRDWPDGVIGVYRESIEFVLGRKVSLIRKTVNAKGECLVKKIRDDGWIQVTRKVIPCALLK